MEEGVNDVMLQTLPTHTYLRNIELVTSKIPISTFAVSCIRAKAVNELHIGIDMLKLILATSEQGE